MSHDEIAELLGAYALDAVEPEEAAVVEAHVRNCPRCAAELAEFHEVAGMLANDGGNAPEDLWDQIAAQATRPPSAGRRPVEPASPLTLVGDPDGTRMPAPREGRRPRAPRRLTMVVIGVAAAVIALMAVQLGRLDSRVSQLSALAEQHGMSQAVQAALLDPNARRITLAGSSSGAATVAELVVLPSGAAYLVNSHLAPLPDDQTYQLWGVVGGRPISLGLLGNQPTAVAFTLDTAAHVSAFAVTAERAGGVVVTTHAPVARSAALTA